MSLLRKSGTRVPLRMSPIPVPRLEDHLSSSEYAKIAGLIQKPENRNLKCATIDREIDRYTKSLKDLQEDLNTLEKDEMLAVYIKTLNSSDAESLDKLMPGKKDLMHAIKSIMGRHERFCHHIQEQIDEIKCTLADLIKIRATMVDLYPEAETSPRMTREQLESSPKRLSSSPRTSNGRRQSATDLMTSPRRKPTDFNRSKSFK